MLTNTEIYFICWIEILVTETYTVLRKNFSQLEIRLII